MHTHRFAIRALAVAAILASAGQAKASLTFFDSQAAYMAAISAPGVDNYESMPWADMGSFVEGQAGEHYYAAWAVAETGDWTGLYAAGSSSDLWLSTNVAADYLTYGYFSDKVNAAGGFFFGTDNMGEFKAGQTIRVNAIDADGVELNLLMENARPDSFYGFVSTSHLEYFQVSALQPNGEFTWVAGNDLTLGSIAAAVPEPASYALLLAGLGLLGAVAQRKRA
jgi:hypothetical protein